MHLVHELLLVVAIAVAVAVAAGCARAREPEVTPEAQAARVVAGWKLSAEELAAIATPGFAELHAEYAAAFDRRAAALAAELVAAGAADGALMLRPQYAEDPESSAEQSRLRWALPVGRPGTVAPGIETVFVDTMGGRRALLGLDDAARARVMARAEAAGCAAEAGRAWSEACREGPCLDALWQLANSALTRGDDDVARACGLVRTMAPRLREAKP